MLSSKENIFIITADPVGMKRIFFLKSDNRISPQDLEKTNIDDFVRKFGTTTLMEHIPGSGRLLSSPSPTVNNKAAVTIS